MYIRKDGYYRLAKQQGYRSRASFKLIQLNNSYGIIHVHDRVLDIGAAPGGWMQVVRNIIGKDGVVVGIDLLDISPLQNKTNKTDRTYTPTAVAIKGDINDAGIRQKALSTIKGSFDAVVSDLSVNLSGDAASDTYRNLRVAESIVGYLPGLLKIGGNFLIKLFYSNDLKAFLADAHKQFDEMYTTKPKASRSSSSELYLIGKGFHLV
jgi:23S rRNA (uridine2552-2'-O)-methyltransferase